MLKVELKERWGIYCDTDKLVDDTMELLTKYHHRCTEYGVCKMLDTYFMNKEHLIDMFQTSQHYIGNMRICVDVELERGANPNELMNFCDAFAAGVGANEAIFKYTDENGKTLKDYSKVGVGKIKAKQLCYGNFSEQFKQNATKRRQFRYDGVTNKSFDEYDRFSNVIYGFRYSSGKLIDDTTLRYISEYEKQGRFTAGMKTSRAFNRICSLHGVDKLPRYNALFTEYADMVSGLKRKLKFYISLNPLDYLTMSFGNSWASCHTIDKRNERNMPNNYSGMHCGGVMSYMLDDSSIITYVHNHATENHEDGKLYRNMFHLDGGTLVQGRIYPQGNDGATDLYKTFRRFMQIELTELLDLEADDWIKRSTECRENVSDTGVHYPDYEHFDGCNVSYPRELPRAANNIVNIGHKRICPYCGEEVSDNEDGGRLGHSYCEVSL